MVPFEFVHELLDNGHLVGPRVHVGRPVRGRFSSSTALWLVVSKDGEWLASGTAVMVMRSNLPRITYDTNDVPAYARLALEQAIGRACDDWRRTLRLEADLRERLANRRANLLAACGRQVDLEKEIAGYAKEIAEIEIRLPEGS